ncbi:MAG: type pullulanase [Actinomycetota bacterium]
MRSLNFRKKITALVAAFGIVFSFITVTPPAEAAGACPTSQCANLIVHYKRNAPSNYDDWGLWLWAFKGAGLPESKVTGFSSTQLDSDGFARLETKVPISAGVTELGLIPRLKSGWTKDVDLDRVVTLDNNNSAEIWIKQGDGYIYRNSSFTIPSEIWGANIQTFRTIKVTLSKAYLGEGSAFTLTGTNAPGILSASKINDLGASSSSSKQWLITTDADIPLGSRVNVVHTDVDSTKTFGSRAAVPAGVFTSQAFIDGYTYTGDDLGATFSAQKTDFRVWAPTASAVNLVTYASATAAANTATVIPMTSDVKGTWTARIDGDKHGLIYNYRVTVGGNTEEAVDPYARSVTINGNRGVVIDLSKTNPTGWLAQAKPAFSGKAVDSVMYELHFRDATKDPSSGVSKANRGKYLGLAQLGTKVKSGNVTAPTGLSAIKDLGVTHVQLLPFYDFASGGLEENPTFNWGYDPKNFNAPEGQYSSDPTNPVKRISELKTAIQAMHKAGLRVTMDVVHGHVASATEFSQQLIVPGYWFRRDSAGNLTNGSGCGNDVATERPMVRKFIVDSMKYWTSEYKLDGFRIDQMGLWDVTTLNQVRAGVSSIEPDATIIGEGWSMGPSIGVPQGTQSQLVNMPGIGAFNDGIRNAVKGSADGESDGGYVNGNPAGTLNAVMAGITGNTSSTILVPWRTLDAGQAVNYAEAHDNLTLFDKLWAVNSATSKTAVAKQSRQIASLIFLAQGTPFIQAGQEFLRSKKGEPNSYNLSDAVNSLKWGKRASEATTVAYYKGLIKLRKAHPAFRMSTPAEIHANIEFWDAPSNVLSYSIDGSAVGDSWSMIMVISNPNKTSKKVDLVEKGNWKATVLGDKAGTSVLATYRNASTVTVAPNSTLVIYK